MLMSQKELNILRKYELRVEKRILLDSLRIKKTKGEKSHATRLFNRFFNAAQDEGLSDAEIEAMYLDNVT